MSKKFIEHLKSPPKFSERKALDFGKPRKVKKSFNGEGLKL